MTPGSRRTDLPGSGVGHGGGGRPGEGLPGVAVAALTAVISGVSVFVNSYGVHSIAQPSVYTAAKNVVATMVLAAFAVVAWRVRGRHPTSAVGRFAAVWGTDPARAGPVAGRAPSGPARWAGLAYVGIVGGGLAFVLFFDGLADTTATPAAFWHDTLVIWVALLAVPFARERVRWWTVAAIGLLVAGQLSIAGGVGHLAADRGELLVLAATLLWAVEVIVAKRLLRGLAPATLSLVRMGIGAATLCVYLAATGALGVLVTLDAGQVGWALLTGLLLAGYVGTWMTALARARAIDVTSVLVASALITVLLQGVAGTAPVAPETLGLLLVAAGTVLVLWMSLRPSAVRGVAAG